MKHQEIKRRIKEIQEDIYTLLTEMDEAGLLDQDKDILLTDAESSLGILWEKIDA